MPLLRIKLLWDLALPLGIAAFAVLVAWRLNADLGVNLAADWLALVFGLFVVDQVIQAREADHARPATAAAWRSVFRLHEHLVLFIAFCLESSWVMQDAADLKAAHEDQDSRYLAKVLAKLLIDRDDVAERERGLRGDGRIAIEAHLSRAVAEADRFMTRFLGALDPSVIELVERLEGCTFVHTAELTGIPVLRASDLVWYELLAVERDLRELLERARVTGELPADCKLRPIAPDVPRWLERKRGWTDAAMRMVNVPRTQPAALAELANDLAEAKAGRLKPTRALLRRPAGGK